VEASEGLLEGMLGATGPLNFTLFLTLMGERVQSAALSSESELLEAFRHFDEQQSGSLSLGQLKDILTSGNGADRLSDQDVISNHLHPAVLIYVAV
jgi:Ca2+-binding EF-hand superfamily protein